MDLLSENIILNEKNKWLIRQAGRQYNIIAVLFSLLSMFAFAIDIVRLYKYLDRDFKEWYNVFNFQLYSALTIVYASILCIQMYHYYKGIKLQNKAIEDNNQESFDRSFRHYVLGNRFSIIAMLIYIPIEIILFYQELYIF